MELQERAQLLRYRFAALVGRPLPKRDKPVVRVEPARRNGYQLRALPQKIELHRVNWVYVDDHKAKPSVKIKRRRGPSALTVIAKKQKPKKLLRDPAKLAAYRL